MIEKSVYLEVLMNYKRMLIFLFICFSALFISCDYVSSSKHSDENESVFFYLTTGHNYSWGTTTLLEEYHCKNLGDDYYEVTSYTVHYFSGSYLNKTPEQLIEIAINRNINPTSIEKRMTTSVLSKTITDYSSKKSIVIYIPEKIKHALFYYEAGYK